MWEKIFYNSHDMTYKKVENCAAEILNDREKN